MAPVWYASRRAGSLLGATMPTTRPASAIDPRDVVQAKRDGLELDPGALRAFVLGFGRGEIPDYVASAFLMAAFIRGLSLAETSAMTAAMVESGATLPFGGVTRPKVDKHSTGGVSDGVSLVFAPLAASLGLAVAKLSGRGLGHTGGTLDKLESIPGFRVSLRPAELEAQVERIGCAIAGQTPDIVPADGALYGLRDATATVASIPLIAASVMSKKLAVGSDLIVLDVKAGSGAFMMTPSAAAELASLCVGLATTNGRRAVAAVTDMSQPLGSAVGNALDVAETVEVLAGREQGRLRDLAVVFAARALTELTAADPDEARGRAERALDDGSALERFASMVEAQGGDPRVAGDPWSVLERAPVILPIGAPSDGFVQTIDAEAIGRAGVALGAGRVTKADAVDPAVGIVIRASIGDRVASGQRIGEVHARGGDAAAIAASRVVAALRLSDEPVTPPPLVHGWHEPPIGI
jgi:pyrimidine-nucleoside phosphorylase